MNKPTSIVLTVLGEDQPGLVKKISEIVVRHHGNWLESHLSTTGSYFGGMIHIEVARDEADSVFHALERLKEEGLDVLLRRSGEEAESATEFVDAELELVGQDRPGIVNQVSEALALRGVNVETLETEYTSAPMSGAEMFTARALLNLPPDVSLEVIQSDLERIAADLMVDLTLQPVRD